MLKIDLRPGESLTIGGMVVVTLEAKSGQLARLSFEADQTVTIRRVIEPAKPDSGAVAT